MNKESSQFRKDLIQLCLGGITVVTAGFTVHPIDTVKIRMQLKSNKLADGTRKYKSLPHGLWKIANEEGIRRGIMKGVEASCLREGSYSTLRIGLYEPIKRQIGGEDGKVWKKFISAGVAGAIASAIANPADVIKTRSQAEPPGVFNPLSWHVRNVYKHHGGINGFYTGVGPTVIRAT